MLCSKFPKTMCPDDETCCQNTGVRPFYSNEYPFFERMDVYPDPHVAKASCGLDCGNTIGDFQDDCGEFQVNTPSHGYTGICRSCWEKGGHSTAER